MIEIVVVFDSCYKESSSWQYIIFDGDERWDKIVNWGNFLVKIKLNITPTPTHTPTHHQNPIHDTKYYFSYI